MDVFAKLNLKDQDPIVVLDAPAEFLPALAVLGAERVLTAVQPGFAVGFALAFVSDQPGLDRAAAALTAQAGEDAVLWIAYPKLASRRYRSKLSRDGADWGVLGTAGYEPVRQVAIDPDWSALRFRQVRHIARMRRAPGMLISAEGRRRRGG